MKCKSGKHEWLDPESVAKCCNGYKHVLRIGSVKNCDTLGSDLLPGGRAYGYEWVKEEDLDRAS